METNEPPRSEETGVVLRPVRQAFSLLELILVVLIVSVVATIAVPRFTEASEGRRLDLASARIAGAIEAWGERARLSHSEMLVAFDQDAETLSLYLGNLVDDRDHVETIELGEEPYRVDIRTGSSLPAETQLLFNGFGLTDSGLDVEIRAGGLSRMLSLP